MKRDPLASMTVDQLIERFAELGIGQYDADSYRNLPKFKRLFKAMEAVNQELKARGPEARSALRRLYHHPNIQVRIASAVRTADEFPEEVRPVLEAIRASSRYPQAADAGMCLDRLDGVPRIW
jgi:hypothetical protein